MKVKSLQHLLVIDDDNGIRALLSKYLKDNGYVVSAASNALEARSLTRLFTFDLMIVDIMMPGESGIAFTKQSKLSLDTPIIMLTAMSDTENRIVGLEEGADDYMSKPFEPKELLLRIQKLLLRSSSSESNDLPIYFGPFTFYESKRQLFKANQEVVLSAKEMDIIAYLLNRKNTVISREELSEACGGMHERSVDVLVTRLRTKIELNPKKPVFLRTVRGEGYVFYS